MTLTKYMEKTTPITLTRQTNDGLTSVEKDGKLLFQYPSHPDGTPDMEEWSEWVPDWEGVVELLLS